MHILSDKLFIDHAQERDFLWSKWQEACKDVHLLQKFKRFNFLWPVAQMVRANWMPRMLYRIIYLYTKSLRLMDRKFIRISIKV